MTRAYSLIVFDWDGTLMDSEARIVACIRESIRDLGLPVRTEAEMKNIIGLGLKEAIMSLYPEEGEALVAPMVERYRYHFLTANPTPSELFDGARETLEQLSDEGYFLAIATGKARAGLTRSLSDTGLGKYFHYTRCADETFSKPHPQMLLDIMDYLGKEPGDTLMIGDTEYDMAMANNAGTGALAVSYGVHEVERLHKHNPLGTIDAIGELTGWLGNITDTVHSSRIA